MLAVINTTRTRPSYLTPNALHLHLDMRWRVVIHRDQLAAVAPVTDKLSKQAGLLNAALLTAPNLLITLKEPIVVQGLYGLERTVTQITLFVDEPAMLRERFSAWLNQRETSTPAH